MPLESPQKPVSRGIGYVWTVLGDSANIEAIMSTDTFLTVTDIAGRLSVHRQTVLRWLQSGELRGVRLGGTKAGWRITEADFAAFLRQREIESLRMHRL